MPNRNWLIVRRVQVRRLEHRPPCFAYSVDRKVCGGVQKLHFCTRAKIQFLHSGTAFRPVCLKLFDLLILSDFAPPHIYLNMFR